MTGITGYAAYLPRYRLERAAVGRAWGTRAAAGTKTVANYDEDALTMAVDSALDVVGDGSGIERLYFASTSAPYCEKQIASLVATACDLPRSVSVADFGGSVRAGTAALRAALEAVAAGGASGAVVAAADTRLAAPESSLEPVLGDGAAALRVGSEGVVAELVSAAAVSEEFTHLWRTNEQRFVRAFEGRFSNMYGYTRDMSEALTAALRRADVSPERVGRLAIAAPDARAAVAVAKRVGCDPAGVERRLLECAGVTGTPDPFLGLVLALAQASPGDLILVGSYGEGADALLFRATRAVERYRSSHDLESQMGCGTVLPSYEKYLKYRRVFPAEPLGEAVSNVLEAQELRQDVRLYGSRCTACGMVQYPMARVCIGCGARESMTAHKIGHRGRIFTFTVDHLSVNVEHPLPMVVIDMDGGGRLYLQATDADPGEIQIGAAVELCFRRLHDGGGNYNYFWKARPARAGA